MSGHITQSTAGTPVLYPPRLASVNFNHVCFAAKNLAEPGQSGLRVNIDQLNIFAM
jgi:hypothetical protein